MARIRTIKPEFWSDEKIGPLAPIHRLVFLGLVSQADDGGRLVDSERLIDGLLFSMTTDHCAESLATLAELGVIERGTTASGQRVVQIVGWAKHQKVDKPSMRGVLPPIVPPNGKRRSPSARANPPSGESREPLAEQSRQSPEDDARSSRYEVDLGAVDLGPSTLDHGPGTEDRDLRAGSGAPSEYPDPELPVDRSVDSLRSPVNGDSDTNPLAGFNAIGSKLAALQLPGGYQAAAELVRERWLYPDADHDAAEAGAFPGADAYLPLARRAELVLEALGDYRAKHPSFEPRLFAGFVRRLADPPTATFNGHPAGHGIVKLHQEAPKDDAPPASAEDRAAGRALVAAAIKPAPEPMPSATIDDPEVIARRESERDRQRALLTASGARDPHRRSVKS